MKILLTNDDGIRAEGFRTLGRVLTGLGHQVFAFAPHRGISACSHAITLRSGLEVKELPPEVFSRAYSCTGTPADCVTLALFHTLRDEEIELVISGINNGLNVGEDTHYSGTVAGAREACIHRAPGIALSIEEGCLEACESFAMQFAERVPSLHRALLESEGIYFNINHPGRLERPDWTFTRPGTRRYLNFIDPLDEKENVEIIAIGGTKDVSGNLEGTDCRAVERGLVSLTPLSLCCYPSDAAEKYRGMLGDTILF